MVFHIMIFKAFGVAFLLVSVILFANFVIQQEGSDDGIHNVNASDSASLISNDSISQLSLFENLSVFEDKPEEIIYKINDSAAVAIISNDSVAQAYMSENFERPEWRVINVSMLLNSTDFNGSEYLWDVKIIERTCACNSIKDLFVIEGQVSPITGEIMNITTGLVLESKYDKKMCASTVCH